LEVIPSSVILHLRDVVNLQATAVFSNGSVQNVTNIAVWDATDPTVATVTSAMMRGRVTAVAPGSTTITVSFEGLTTDAPVTVSAAALTRLTVSPAGVTLVPGQMQPYAATAFFDDGTNQNVTGMTLWSSSDRSVADISNAPLPGQGGRGTATAFAPGTTTISG